MINQLLVGSLGACGYKNTKKHGIVHDAMLYKSSTKQFRSVSYPSRCMKSSVWNSVRKAWINENHLLPSKPWGFRLQ